MGILGDLSTAASIETTGLMSGRWNRTKSKKTTFQSQTHPTYTLTFTKAFMVEVSGGLEWTYQYFWDPDLGYLSERTPLKEDRTLDVDVLSTSPNGKSPIRGERKRESMSLVSRENNKMRQEIDYLKKEVESLSYICKFQEKNLQNLTASKADGREVNAMPPAGSQIPPVDKSAFPNPISHDEGRAIYNSHSQPHFRPHDPSNDYYEAHYPSARSAGSGSGIYHGQQPYGSSRIPDPMIGHDPRLSSWQPRSQYHQGYYDYPTGEANHYHARPAYGAPQRPHNQVIHQSQEVPHQPRVGRYPARGHNSAAQWRYGRDSAPPQQEVGRAKVNHNSHPLVTPTKDPVKADPSLVNPNSGSRASKPSSEKKTVNAARTGIQNIPAKPPKPKADPVGEPNPYANVVPPKEFISKSKIEQKKQKDPVPKKKQNVGNPYANVVPNGEGSKEKPVPGPRLKTAKKAKGLIMGPHDPAGDELLRKFMGENNLKKR